jgi:hypothetical protein
MAVLLSWRYLDSGIFIEYETVKLIKSGLKLLFSQITRPLIDYQITDESFKHI